MNTETQNQIPGSVELTTEKPKSFLQSKTFWGAAMLVLSAFGNHLGIDAEMIDKLWKTGLGTGLWGLRTKKRDVELPKILGRIGAVKLVAVVGFLATSFAALSLSSCAGAVRVAPDGCVMREVERDGQRYSLGVCLGGDGSVERVVVEWQSLEGVSFQAIQYLDDRGQVIRYRVGEEPWLSWSSETGVFVGPLPPEVAQRILETRGGSRAEVTKAK